LLPAGRLHLIMQVLHMCIDFRLDDTEIPVYSSCALPSDLNRVESNEWRNCMSGLKRMVAARIVGRPGLAVLAGIAGWLLGIGYLLRFLAWTGSQNLRERLLDKGKLPRHDRRFELYTHLLSSHRLDQRPLWYVEFGVAKGDTINWWRQANQIESSCFIGHDSFFGLPEAWAAMPKGGFSTEGKPPEIPDPRVSFVKGWFRDTVSQAGFARPSPDHVLYAHLDADLYGSTSLCLHALYPHLRPGDILVFDEFAYPQDEFRSLLDFELSFGLRLNVIAAVNCGDVIAFEVAALEG